MSIHKNLTDLIGKNAVLWAATKIAMRESAKDKIIVVIFPDTGERYLSTALFQD